VVYILQSELDPERYYVGVTYKLDLRLEEHNAGLDTYSRKFKPWRVKTAIYFRESNKAFLFERYLKTGSGRAFIKRHFD
jgi:predicted GIY-YIG superfamily endonuclease